MYCRILLLCGLVCLAAGAVTKSPVEKVVHLLEDMRNKLEQDEKVEQKVYDKYACWCEKTTARKAKDIEFAQQKLRFLAQKILTTKGQIEVLEAEIAEKEKQIEENLDAQEKATANRQKKNAEFMAMQEETKEALSALEQAVIVLRNATTPGGIKEDEATLLQQKQGLRAKAMAAVQTVVSKLPQFSSLKNEQASALGDFLQAGSESQYTPQSGTVQGILKDMYDTFARDLESATFEEGVSNRDYENFMHTKAVELAELRRIKAEKEKQKAEKEELLATTQAEYDDTEEQMKADIVFFDEVKAGCELKHEQWTLRSTLRSQELAGVNKALDILTTDAARDLFGKSITAGKETGASSKYDTKVDISSPVFLQISSDSQAAAAAADNAYNALKHVSSKAKSIRLAAIAVAVRTAKAGHFDQVIKDINDMMQELKDEEADDIAKRDQCKEEYFKTDSKIKQTEWLIKNNKAKIQKINSQIEEHEEEVRECERQIQETTWLMGNLTKIRQGENQQFLSDKKDDQDAIKLLTDARDVLSKYYVNHSIDMGPIQGDVKAMMLQKQKQPEFDISADQAPEADFSGKGSRKYEAKGIVQILEYIIMDLNDEIKNDMAGEEETQVHYEKEMAAADKFKGEMILKKIDLQDAIADLKEDRTAENKKLKKNEFDLKDEEDYRKSITPDCEWIFKAFYPRAEGRAAEMKGLTEAKEFLSEWANKDNKNTYTQESDKDLGATYAGAAAMLQKPASNKGFLKAHH